MENLVNQNLFGGVYKGKKVFVTGHTGFKGSWMCFWLTQMGAEVYGYSLEAPTVPNHIEKLQLNIQETIGDIRDKDSLESALSGFQPDIVFHMAAQPLVKLSYKEPIETFETNVIGSMRVYEACRKTPSVESIVTITTDKVYENNEWDWGYRENDKLGGKDPYSASKAAMEIMTNSYRESYFNINKYGSDHNVLMATVRAGNVIGGGDWALDRLIPDIVKASVDGNPVSIRSPYSTRPWQHVLEPLSGYLMIGQKLIEKDKSFADAYNFGPSVTEDVNVEEVVTILRKYWETIDYRIERPKEVLHEAGLLKLDCTKAYRNLRWIPVWNVEDALKNTILWYKEYYENNEIKTELDLNNYIACAKEKSLAWTK
ncbi:CDP-glucose 4,6-dehydratase [Halobacteriovorax marinus]|uniref:CDP-glucose 4,6-dehydratase n=1 Tax=Halobacteriovorax marinus TaxID=97084 RepID=UPI0002D7706B|nr:CDP-glucose 4,6-dehydratase [Halobacteriovorax marinus]